MRRLVPFILLITACSSGAGADAATAAPEQPITTVATTTTAAPTTVPPAPAAPETTAPTTTAPPIAVEPVMREIFAWMPGGLTEEFIATVMAVEGVESVGVITSVTMHLEASHKANGTQVDSPPAGFVIPLHGATVDAAALGAVFDLPTVAPDEVILGDDSAALRRLAVGDSLTFESGGTFTVGAVVAEDLMAGYEAIATVPEAFESKRMQARAMMVRYPLSPTRLDIEIKRRLGDSDLVYAVRERSDSADRGGLVVRSQVFIKEHFGEFAYRPTGNGRFQIDPGWVAENIVEVNIPLLGTTKCHRVMAEILIGIMQDLVDNDLAEVIDRSAYAGCWNARYIAGSARLSRHSFGAAADINIFNPTDGGPGSPVHPELLERIYAAGLTSGHVWANADPGHFEFFNPVPAG